MPQALQEETPRLGIRMQTIELHFVLVRQKRADDVSGEA